jgi:hypothetical protein
MIAGTAIDRSSLTGAASDLWAGAAASRGAVRRFYRWDAHVVCVEFAGSDLLPVLTPALAHRETDAAAQPSLTIAAWSGGPALAAGVERDVSDECGVGVARSRGTVSLLDRAARRGYFWTPSADAIPGWIAGSPWRTLLHWWWRSHGLQVVHGAAVATAGQAVLLAGPGGAGKSTTTFACLRRGLDVLAEDHCLLAVEEPVTVFGLYSAGKLTDATLAAFPELREMVADLPGTRRCEGGKQLFFLDSRFRARFPERAQVKAMLIPTMADRATSTIVPASRADGLRAIAPSTLLQLPGAGSADLRQLTRLASHVPIHRLELGRDLDRAVAVITDFLAS